MLRTVIRIYRFISKKLKIEVFLLIFVDGINAILNILSIGTLIPVLNIVLGIIKLSDIKGYSQYIKIVSMFPFLDFFFYSVDRIVLLTIFFLLFKNILQIFIFKFSSRINIAISNEFSTKLENYYYNLSVEEVSNINKAKITLSLDHARVTVIAFVSTLILISNAAISSLSLIIFLVYIFPITVLLIFFGVGFIVFGYYKLMNFLTQKNSGKINEIEKDLNETKHILFDNIREVFLFDVNYLISTKAKLLRIKISNFYKSYHEYQSYSGISIEILIVFLLIVLKIMISSSDNIVSHLPKFAITVFAILRILPQFIRISHLFVTMQTMNDKISDMLDDTEIIKERANSISEKKMKFEEKIEFKNISFHYKSKSTKFAINDLNLTIKIGETIGIVGKSGSGKSTFADLLIGAITPTSGTILVDKENLDSSKWKNNISIVPQSVGILNDTIARNIAFGVEDKKIDLKLVNSSLQQAELQFLIDGSSDGLNTNISVGKISGGQKQRIGIARAFYFNRDVLILDEATSALDVKTESDIAKSIYKLKGRKTILIIAHRLSTLKHCDRILYFSEGKLVDSGTFKELGERYPDFDEMLKMSNVN